MHAPRQRHCGTTVSAFQAHLLFPRHMVGSRGLLVLLSPDRQCQGKTDIWLSLCLLRLPSHCTEFCLNLCLFNFLWKSLHCRLGLAWFSELRNLSAKKTPTALSQLGVDTTLLCPLKARVLGTSLDVSRGRHTYHIQIIWPSSPKYGRFGHARMSRKAYTGPKNNSTKQAEYHTMRRL